MAGGDGAPTLSSLRHLAGLIRARIGISVPPEREEGLRHFVAERSVAVQCSEGELIRRLESSELHHTDWRDLIGVVSNGHTSFYRDANQLDLVREALRRRRQKNDASVVHLWSCACSSGEEPYTLAMIGQEVEIAVRVLGTDVNEDALARGAAGHYHEWSLRRLSHRQRERFFYVDGEDYVVRPQVRESVTFRHYNLLDARWPESTKADRRWDVVLCRNVLIYFELETVRQTVARLTAALSDDGLLVLGAADALCLSIDEMRRVQPRVLVAPSTPPPAFLPGADRARGAVESFRLAPPPVFASVAEERFSWAEVEAAGRRGAWARVVDRLERRLRDVPDDLRSWLVLGSVQLFRHEFDAAAEAYLQAYELQPLEGEVHAVLALLHRRRGDH
ncbi:MAG: CheR family methyltransferase, partial [Myxococcota bacterium]